MNFELKVKEILKETFILTGFIKNEEIINNLKNFIEQNKDEKLSHKTNVLGHFTGFKSLIDNKNFIDFLKIIQPNIKVVFPHDFIISDAWGNICSINDEVIEHAHEGVTGFCGILYLTKDGPGTYFKEYDLLIEEKVGKYVLFSPSLKHKVEKLTKNLKRITVAFNINQVKDWEDYSNYEWIK